MIKTLLYIKRHFGFIWQTMERMNDILFKYLHGKRMRICIDKVLSRYNNDVFRFRQIEEKDLEGLHQFFQQQDKAAFEYFTPHAFDKETLRRLYKYHSFIMFGVFDTNEALIGYFFLRCMASRRAFRGKIVDKHFYGNGIAKKIGLITMDICSLANFRLYATVSQDNLQSILSSRSVNNMRIIKHLPKRYIYLEYTIKKDNGYEM